MYGNHLMDTVHYRDALLRNPRPGSRRRARPPAILTATVQLLAAAESRGLSMRRLATHLGVTPNALYNHFQNKTELIDALFDDALGLVVTPTTDDPRDDPRKTRESYVRSTCWTLQGVLMTDSSNGPSST